MSTRDTSELFSYRTVLYITIGVAGMLGVAFGGMTLASFCLYPDDVPCAFSSLPLLVVFGIGYVMLLGGIPIFIVVALGLAYATEGTPRQRRVSRGIGRALLGAGWALGTSGSLIVFTYASGRDRLNIPFIIAPLLVSIVIIGVRSRRAPAQVWSFLSGVGGMTALLLGLMSQLRH